MSLLYSLWFQILLASVLMYPIFTLLQLINDIEYDRISEVLTGLHSHLESNKSNFEIYLFPNPATDFLSVKLLFFNSLVNVSEYHLLDLAGSEIKKRTLERKENEIDISNFKEGQYLFQIKNENELITKSFTIEK